MDNRYKVGIASDHAGFELKEYIKLQLCDTVDFTDFGTDSEDSVDYPDFMHPLASKVNSGELPKGIIICGTGNGAAITANKYPKVRAALCWNDEIAKLARQHNDANIISLPARFVTKESALELVKLFFNTPFEGGRHQRRIDKIDNIITNE